MSLPANLPRRLFRADHEFTLWGHAAPPGHTLEHVMNPDYWVHAMQSVGLKALDEIRVIADDRSYFVHLLVTDVDPARQWARVRLLHTHWHDEPAKAENDSDGYKIEFSGPHKWRVLTAAGAVAAKGMSSREEAVAALASLKASKAA